MPSKKASATKKPTIPGVTPTIGKGSGKAKGKAKGGLRRGQAYNLLKALGRAFAGDTTLDLSLANFTFVTAQRRNFLDRALDKKTKKLAKNELFGGRYRSSWGEQDELFSTASSRSFIEGLLNGVSRDQIADDVWQRWTAMVDLISALRIPTAYSGFSTATLVMQHPTALGTGYFSPLAVTESHGTYDSERVKYIGRAIQRAQAASLGAVDQLRAAMRAAIEFSLNHFTAPVTASNVKPFSNKSTVASGDDSMQDQLASRERIKDIYVQLGGSLRDLPQTGGLPTTETPEQSWDRAWQQGLTITVDDPFPVAPPSPRRSRRKADSSTTDPLATPVQVGGTSTSPGVTNPFASTTTTTVSIGGSLLPTSTTPLSAPVFSFAPLPQFTGFTFAPSTPLTPFALPLFGAQTTLASDVVRGMTQAMQSMLDTVPSVPQFAFPSLPVRDPVDSIFDRLFDDPDPFDSDFWARDLSVDAMPDWPGTTSASLGSSDWFTDTIGPLPSAPPLEDMFASLPSAPPLEEMFPPLPSAPPLEDEFDPYAPDNALMDDAFDTDMFALNAFDPPVSMTTQQLFNQLPSVPTNPPGMAQNGMDVTDDMFPAVPTGVPGMGAGEVGAEAAGGEELLAVLLV